MPSKYAAGLLAAIATVLALSAQVASAEKYVYFFNSKTNESQWDDPPASASGWVSRQDPKTEREYFYNENTKESQWEKPEDLEWHSAIHDEL
ncbi:hypothetical protein PPROV_000729100 [Pycnococcus provasolii]|uniref:WW domain-containing protein n=1 Tax=Pycnococcus provasolii TaxID=41880 RepID=A0A830HMZ2_9CHLO|nr:hypothetical protein PPROV_000729100 [Pycnococcus provasolii]